MKLKQQGTPLNIMLADDDRDDRFFFTKALKEIPIATHLTTVNDGEQLMDYLSENSVHLPDVLFLDLSMPRKTGFECLSEIKENKKLKELPVIMFSTSYTRGIDLEHNLKNTLLKMGAQDYIRKGSDYSHLKQTIHHVLIKEMEKRLGNVKGDNV